MGFFNYLVLNSQQVVWVSTSKQTSRASLTQIAGKEEVAFSDCRPQERNLKYVFVCLSLSGLGWRKVSFCSLRLLLVAGTSG